MGVVRFANTNPADAERLNPGRPVDERWPLMPTGNPYSDTKIAAEQLVLAAHAAGELPCTIIRPSDIYGPGCRPWVLQPLAMIRKGLFLLPERGKGLFCPVYVDDVVDAVVRAAESEAGCGQIFQVGGEACVTAEEYFGHFYRMLGKPGPPRSFSTPVAVAIAETARVGFRLLGKPTELGRGVMVMLAKKRTFSNAKARTLLGWAPRVPLEEGMRRTEAWLHTEGLL
jgi:nucleoside-diphosphate-sugar epimerase